MSDKLIHQSKWWLVVFFTCSGIAYYWLSYQTVRSNFPQVFGLFSFLFIAYYFAYKYLSFVRFKFLIASGICFRLLLLFAAPNLSDDVYRFIWDGRLAANGTNPFSYLPAEIMTMKPIKGITPLLYAQLNSPNYFAIYPPILQSIFWLTAKVFPTNVAASIVFMKGIVIAVEVVNIVLATKLLTKLKLPKERALLYVLNPLVIVELSGNVHFEGVMILFVLLSFVLLLNSKWMMAATSLAAGIATKLLPVLLVPILFFKLGLKKGLMFSLITGVVTVILFALQFDAKSLAHLLDSVGLFVQNFEFNASVYYLARWIGTTVVGYNLIAYIGPLLYACACIIIMLLSIKAGRFAYRQLFSNALFILSIWLLFSTTVHPWYICFPLALSVLTAYRFAIVWSFTATLSYAAYQTNPVHENLWLVAAGYIAVISFAVWELTTKRNTSLEHSSFAIPI